MKKFFTVLGLTLISMISYSQNQIVLLNETFNIPIFEASDFVITTQNPDYCGSSQFEFELSQSQTYDNSPCLKINSCYGGPGPNPYYATGYVNFGFVPTLNLDSIQITFNEKNNASGYLFLQTSTNNSTWFEVAQYLGGPNNSWLSNSTTLSWIGDMDSLAFRLVRVNNVVTRIDNFKITGFTSTPPPPPSCDTVFIELPPIHDTIYVSLPPDTILIDNFIYITDTIYIVDTVYVTDTVYIYTPIAPDDHLGLDYFNSSPNKTLIKVIDTTGREVPKNTPGVVIYVYSDGTTEKKYQIIQ